METDSLLGEVPPPRRGWRWPLALLSLAACAPFLPHGKALRGELDQVPRQLSLLLFDAVDGGLGRACRGETANDNNPAHFQVTSATDLASCQLFCLELFGCQGVEFHLVNGRCELWTRPEGIQASVPFGNADCYRRVGMLEPVDGGQDRACRGADAADNNPIYYELRVAFSLADCELECLRTAECRGMEYSSGRCELWTRPEGIGASISLSGFQCFRAVSLFAPTETSTSSSSVTTLTSVTSSFTTSLTTSVTSSVTTVTATQSATVTSTSAAAMLAPSPVGFRALDGGVDRVCRGADEFDNDPSYFVVYDVDDLDACKDLCRMNTTCVGVENIGRRCEMWIRPEGIEATRNLADYQCLEALRFHAVDGGEGRACRRNTPGDNSETYYTVFTEVSLEACQERCVVSENCTGVEFSGNRCEVWNQTILASIALTGFHCFSYAGRVRENFLADVSTSLWDVTGGLDMECRGANLTDDSPSYYSLVQANSLQRCQERCLELTICLAIEYRPGRCELWTRPEGVTRKALANALCLGRPSSSPAGALKTKYVVHYMPWFQGFNNGLYDHWCVGNHHYEGYLGQYNSNNRTIVQRQLDLMKNQSIDGLWIDYQLSAWNDAIDIVMEETALRGMGVAIVMDSVTNQDIFVEAQQKMVEWTSWPHYYRYNGVPVVPLFQTPDINFQAFPFEAYYIVRRDGPILPEWANGSYPWVTPSLNSLEAYYQVDHTLSSFAVGAAYRGFRDCYDDVTLITPFLEMLGPTLLLASKYQPEFVQVITWNDYSEGTMIEPSWVRMRDTCLDVCEEQIQPCLTSASCNSGFDPSDCTKPYGAFEGPVDPQCNSNRSARADDDLRLLRDHIVAEAAGTLNLHYDSGMFHQTVMAASNWYHRTSEDHAVLVK